MWAGYRSPYHSDGAAIHAGQLETISRELGEAMTGSQLSRLLSDAGIADISTQSTKWTRIYDAMAAR